MTDVVDTPTGEAAITPTVTAGAPAPGAPLHDAPVQDAPAQWAPQQPAQRSKRRVLLAVGIPVGVLALGAVAASLILIAPGTTVAGVPVGFLTAGAASDAISSRLADTEVTIGDGGPNVSGADLGATVDAQALATAAFDAHPMWNVTTWFSDSEPVEVTLDAEAAAAALRTASPDHYIPAQPASVAFAGGKYTVTPAVDGQGVDVEAVRAGLEQAMNSGAGTTQIELSTTPVAPSTTTEMAQATASELNDMLETVGFYVGDERTVAVSPETVATWLTVDADADGELKITADPAQIQKVVAGLKDEINQTVADATVIANSAGTVLRTSIEGADGRVLGATTGIASEFAAQLSDGNGVFTLPVEVTPHKTVEKVRLLEVDLSEQRLYLKENGAVVDSWPISSGLDISPTHQGRFTVNWHVRSQTMRSTDPDNPYWTYEVPNVEWIMYFNGDQAFHGVYWHNSFGTQQSHGCVGMPNWRAEQIYQWAPTGADVWIHG
ncbi:L,D-transpeptidase family protein [Microbacterium sp.]|uniref:L,D-transpeptidase family protein n=1 Tax=Microbacterium sp. TaxID=51671 RepID=UPI003A857ED8